MIGLTVESTKHCLDEYENRFSQDTRVRTEVLGAIIGVITGVACEVFAILNLIALPRESVGLPVFRAIMGVEFGWIGGFAVFGCAIGVGKYLTARKIDALKQFRLGLDKFYHGAAELENSTVSALLKMVDTQAAKELAEPMNFNQLYAARRVLGNKKFAQVITGVNQSAHELWRQILEVSPAPEAVRKYLSCDNVKRLQNKNPELWVGLRDFVGFGVDEYLFPNLETESQSKETLVIKIGEKRIELNKELLAKNCPYFEGRQEVDLTEDAKALNVDIVPLLEFLAGKKRGYSPDLIPFASHFRVEKMETVLDTLLVMNHFDMSLEERCAIVSKYPGYPKLREHLIRMLRNREITDANFEEMCGFAKKLSCYDIKRELQEYALKKLKIPDSSWLERALSLDVTCEKIHKQLPDLSAANFSIQYEIGMKLKELGYSELANNCLEFCRQSPSEVRGHLTWKIEEMPDEVVEILFPLPKVNF